MNVEPLLNELIDDNQVSLTDSGEYKERLGFSKGLVVFADSLFALVVVSALCTAFELVNASLAGQTINNANAIATIYASLLTFTGGGSITAHVWYYKKTQAGHTAKTQADVYMVVADKEVECKKELMQTQHDLKLTDLEVSKTNIQRVDSMTSGAFNAMDNNLKTAMQDATQLVKKETGA